MICGVENMRLGKKRLALIVLLISSGKELIDFHPIKPFIYECSYDGFEIGC